MFFSHWVRVGKLSTSDFCSLLISSFHSYIVPQHKYLSIYKSVLCLNIQKLQFISKSWFNGFHTFLLPTSTLLCKQNELMLGLGKLRDEDVHLEENSDAPKRSKKSHLLLACYCLGGGGVSGWTEFLWTCLKEKVQEESDISNSLKTLKQKKTVFFHCTLLPSGPGIHYPIFRSYQSCTGQEHHLLLSRAQSQEEHNSLEIRLTLPSQTCAQPLLSNRSSKNAEMKRPTLLSCNLSYNPTVHNLTVFSLRYKLLLTTV